MGEGLPSSGLCVGSGSRGSEVGEFVGGLCSLVLHGGSNWACGLSLVARLPK